MMNFFPQPPDLRQKLTETILSPTMWSPADGRAQQVGGWIQTSHSHNSSGPPNHPAFKVTGPKVGEEDFFQASRRN